MADVYTQKGFDGAGWNIDLSGNYLSPQGANFGDGVSVSGFQESNHKSNSGMSSDLCTPDHIRNCKYVSPTQVSLMGGAPVTLNETNVGDIDCSVRRSYQDDTPVSTALSNIRLFAFDGSVPANPPTGVTVLAFERTGSGINKDRISDTPGDGGAWDSAKGIGGSANALDIPDRASASTHYFYFGISMSPTSKGQKTGKMRVEFDAQ